MSMRTSFWLSTEAMDALDDLRAAFVGLSVGVVLEQALKRLEADWRSGRFKKTGFPRGEKKHPCLTLTNEAMAVADRLVPAMKMSRNKIVDLALRRCGEQLRTGKIRGIGLLVS